MNDSGVAVPTKILVVEDDLDYREMVVEALAAHNFDVKAVVSGEDAIKSIIEHGDTFDVTLMDVNLPGINGLETMRKLRDAGYRGHIIALTGQPRYEARALAQGADRFKVKPLSTKELLDTIATVMM